MAVGWISAPLAIRNMLIMMHTIAKKVIPLLATDTLVLIQGSSGECEQLLCSECKMPRPCCEET